MNRSRIHQGTVAAGLLVLTSIIGLLAIVIGLNLSTNVPRAFADAPSGTISASVNGTTVNLSGGWNFDACKENNKKKVVGFGLFIDGNNPIAGPSLDTGMHLPADQVDSGTPGQVPCTNDTGTWSDSHVLAPGEHQVCVVFYDPHIDKGTGQPKVSGDHSLILAGPNHNRDNSFEKNDDSFPGGTCAGVSVPEVERAEGVLTITKSADDATTTHGDTVTYTFNVTYAPGEDGSPAQNIVVTDPQCDSGPTRGADNTGNDDDLLEDGETWVYTCTFTVPDHSDGEEDPILNVAHVEGKDLDGDAVAPDDSDEVSVDIEHAAGLGAAQLPTAGGLPPSEGGASLTALLYILMAGAAAIIVGAIAVRRWRLSTISTRVIGNRGGRDDGWTWGSGSGA